MTKTTTRLTVAIETYLTDLQRIRASGGATGEWSSYGSLANITLVSQYRSDWGMAFAGLVLIMAPTMLVYAFLQQYLTKEITVGALKG